MRKPIKQNDRDVLGVLKVRVYLHLIDPETLREKKVLVKASDYPVDPYDRVSDLVSKAESAKQDWKDANNGMNFDMSAEIKIA